MDGDLSERLRSVLSDPEAMSRIAAIAGSLSPTAGNNPAPGGSGGSNYSDQSSPTPSGESANVFSALPEITRSAPVSAERDPRVALLYSLKPLLREEKREKVDTLARALAVVSLFKSTRK